MPVVSHRDPGELRARFASYLAAQLPPDAAPEIVAFDAPESTGFSSETLLIRAVWSEDGERVERGLAVRLPPDPEGFPIFRTYDLAMQHRCLDLVASQTSVPVPTTRWLETDPAALGSPFLVMDRVEGEVPPDVLPYPLGSWLTEATPLQLAQLERSSVEILAGVHRLDPTNTDLSFLADGDAAEGDEALRHHVARERAFYEWAREGQESDLIEAMFGWIERHWPASSPPVMSWGDSRIGNVMYRDFEPVAVFDWEMACVGPRELDVGWMVWMHRFFQDIAAQVELPGLPDLLTRDSVAAIYEEASGYEPRDLVWYEAYAALRFAVISLRTTAAAAEMGQTEPPEHADDAIMHRRLLEQLLADGDWS